MASLGIAVYGIVVSVITFILFYTLGVATLPSRFFCNRISQPFFATFAGAGVFSFICWFGVQGHFSLFHLFFFIIVLTIFLSCIRHKHFINIYKQSLVIHTSVFWLISYILLYGLVYIFVPLPDTKKYLPITWSYNVDIFNYINVTQYFISSAADSHYFWPYYYQTPAVFYFYAWMSLFFHQNAMLASMPILYSAAAGIGLLIIFYCHYIFHCPKKIAFGIAAVILSGSFYRYIIDVYFLSSLLGTIVWLAFLMEILQWKMEQKNRWNYIFTIFIYQSLLLLTYSVLFTFNLIILPITLGLTLFFSNRHLAIKPLSWQTLMKQEIFFIACLFLAISCLIILFPGFIKGTFYNLSEFAHRTGVLGFTLLSPPAMLGFPSFFEEISSTYIPLTTAFILCLAGFLYALNLAKLNIKPAAYALLFLIIGAFFVYFLYYYMEGSSRYQPWKFASYFILPLGGVFWALAFRLKPIEKPFLIILSVFVSAHYLWFPIQHQPPISNDYEKISLLNKLPEKELYIKAPTLESTFLTVFYVREKHIHLLSSSFHYYPRIKMKDVPKDVQVHFLNAN